jgi:hypothetical protein
VCARGYGNCGYPFLLVELGRATLGVAPMLVKKAISWLAFLAVACGLLFPLAQLTSPLGFATGLRHWASPAE